ncbi:MAG: NAD(P)-dependent alcohol dehydrogenase [Sphingomonadales bacterium]|jgi:NADPH:quinone reductase-like Zn-dependent oxidoreductase
MKAYQLDGGFGFENLKQVEIEEPIVGPGEVKVTMKAATLNYRDLLIISGAYNPKQKLPLIPVSDGAGVVEAVGDGVHGFNVGDEVIPLFNQKWMGGPPSFERLTGTLGSPIDGVMAEKRVFKARGLVKKPGHLSLAEGAALPCAAVTAWTTLVSEAGLSAGQTVLIQGTGGVSIFALQFAKALGAEAIVTSSSDEKLVKAQALGADHLINYKKHPNWSKVVKEITNGRGVDVVVEVGGAGTLDQSLRCLKFGGFIGVIGVLAGASCDIPLTRILMQHARLQGITVGSRDDMDAMTRAIALHDLHPVIDDKRFGFDALVEALMYMGSGQHFGKIALEF